MQGRDGDHGNLGMTGYFGKGLVVQLFDNRLTFRTHHVAIISIPFTWSGLNRLQPRKTKAQKQQQRQQSPATMPH